MAASRLSGRELLEVAGLLGALGFVALAFAELSRRLSDRIARKLPR